LKAAVRFIAALCAAALAASAAAQVGDDDLETRCESYLGALDAIVRDAGAADAEAARVPGFPYLRTDRFLASWRGELPEDALRPWVDAMLRLDEQSRIIELANLSDSARRRVAAAAPRAGLMEARPLIHIQGCAKVLRERDLGDAGRRRLLRERAAAPDSYDTWKRIVGLYWLTRIPFAAGVRDYESRVMAAYAAPVDASPPQGTLVRYAPFESFAVSPIVARDAAARILEAAEAFESPDIADVHVLLAAHAPAFEVDEALPADRIGYVHRAGDGAPGVDTGQALLYGRVAYTRFAGRIHVQLVYTAWFPARPRASTFDMLGGDWDGVVWRVTLDTDARPLVYDTMHACGCYHMFYPTPRLEARPRPDSLDEWALVPQRVDELEPGRRVRLRIASRTHYVERVLTDAAPADRSFGIVPDVQLRSLPFGDAPRRSLYGPNGLVAGSERGERWLFWPMGIAEPGAMRQWGHHATAFVGRRHFDDADLLDRYFVRR